MRNVLKLIAGMILFAGVQPAGATTDEELRAAVEKMWITTSSGAGVHVLQSTTYEADGTFRTSYLLSYEDKSRGQDAIMVSGVWTIKDGIFTETVAKCSAPERMPVGAAFRRTFDVVTPDRIVLRAEDGKTTAEMISAEKAAKDQGVELQK